MNILIIEDEETLADVIRVSLENNNYQVEIEGNGKEGYYKALNDTYDLIILDVMLPDMDGFTILKKLREDKINTKIIMLTAKSTLDDKLEGLENEWNMTNSNSLVFANLGSGDYTLKIKTITQHGVMSDESSVHFTINPPIWRSNYAICIYLILIIISILRYIHKVNKLDRLVNERTKELRKEIHEIDILSQELFARKDISDMEKANFIRKHIKNVLKKMF